MFYPILLGKAILIRIQTQQTTIPLIARPLSASSNYLNICTALIKYIRQKSIILTSLVQQGSPMLFNYAVFPVLMKH